MSTRNRKTTLPAWALTALLGLAAAGCLHVPPEEHAAWPPPADPAFHIRPGDTLLVRFQRTPELDDEQKVRPDGRIALKLIGEVEAAGKAPEQLTGELETAYAAQVREPDISVVIRGLDSHRVYVAGEVLRAGPIQMDGPMTIAQAIMYAGGFNKAAAKQRRVIVLRQRGETQFARTVDVLEQLESGNSTAFFVEPFDIVYVPRTRIDRANQWVSQYIDGMIPDNVNFGMNYTFFREVDEEDPESRNITIAP